jgi:hypothetical protein
MSLIAISQDDSTRYFAWKISLKAYISRITSETKDDFKRPKALLLHDIYKRSITRLSLDSNKIPFMFHIAKQHVHAHKYDKSYLEESQASNFIISLFNPMKFYSLLECLFMASSHNLP